MIRITESVFKKRFNQGPLSQANNTSGNFYAEYRCVPVGGPFEDIMCIDNLDALYYNIPVGPVFYISPCFEGYAQVTVSVGSSSHTEDVSSYLEESHDYITAQFYYQDNNLKFRLCDFEGLVIRSMSMPMSGLRTLRGNFYLSKQIPLRTPLRMQISKRYFPYFQYRRNNVLLMDYPGIMDLCTSYYQSSSEDM